MAGEEQRLQSEPVSIPNPSDEGPNRSEVPTFSGSEHLLNTRTMLPVMYPLLVPGLSPYHSQEPTEHGPGLYAVPTHPFSGLIGGLPSNDLIPLRYTIPTRSDPAGAPGSEQGLTGRQHQGPQRQVVVRRFQFAIQLDIFLILKLLAVVILFNQDGSRQRLMILLLFAAVVYLHQTGALAPIVRWLRRQEAPPQPRPAARAAEGAPFVPDNANAPGENQDQLEGAVENENPAEAEAVDGGNGGNWWAIVHEIRMIVIGFITSLLPGFHPHND